MAPAARPPAARAPVAAKPQAPAKRAEKPQLVTAKRAAAGGNGSGPVPRMQAALATAVNQDADWKEF